MYTLPPFLLYFKSLYITFLWSLNNRSRLPWTHSNGAQGLTCVPLKRAHPCRSIISRVNSLMLLNCRALVQCLFCFRYIPEPPSGRMTTDNWKEKKVDYNPDRILWSMYVYLCPPGPSETVAWLREMQVWSSVFTITRNISVFRRMWWDLILLQQHLPRAWTQGRMVADQADLHPRSADVTLTWGCLSASVCAMSKETLHRAVPTSGPLCYGGHVVWPFLLTS